jgi:hypothetical protein
LIVNFSCAPLLIPAPHLDGSVQVMTPACSVQPWLVNSAFAAAMSNGYGPCPPLAVSTEGTYWLFGWVGTGPLSANP